MRIVIVGDTLLDKDITCTASRLSPDGPVPVLDVRRTRYRPGGAGLVAAVLAHDARSHPLELVLVTALSDDDAAHQLTAALESVTRGRVEIIAGALGAPTPVKTRLRSGGHPVARVDEGCGPAPLPEATAQMCEAIASADVLLVADYGRGLTANPDVRTALRRRGQHVPLVWDPHPSGSTPVPECQIVTPNLPEASGWADEPETFEAADVAGRVLRRRWGCDAVAVTTGDLGVVLTSEGEEPVHVRADRVENADTCGAGDRFAATLARSLGQGEDLTAALRGATEETAAFLRGGGVARMDTSLERRPTRALDAAALAADVRARGGTVVATGGCFDLMHAGHARTLASARDLGDCLIVCVNSDASVRRIKGRGRPIMPETDRVEMLMSLQCVDAVVVFDDDTPVRVLRELRPDVWVKGGDYTRAALPETRVLATWGGRVEMMPIHPGRSTTHLVSVINQAS